MECNDIVKRFDVLKRDRSNIENTWSLIEQFIAPIRGGKFFYDRMDESSIDWRIGRTIYDDTAVNASQMLASSIHGAITSASSQWFAMNFRNKALQKSIEAKEWIQECAKLVWETLIDSNFNTEINEFYLDLVHFGNGAISEEAETENGKWDGVDFTCIPIRECFFEEDHKGNIINFYRPLEWEAGKIVSKFGLDKCPEKVRVAHEAGRQDKFVILFCIYRRKEIPLEAAAKSKILAPQARPFGFKYVFREDKTQIGEEGGYYEMPVFISPWLRASGSRWGYGPSTLALSNVLTLNQLMEIYLKALEKGVDPAIIATERGLLSDLDLKSGGLTIVRDLKGSVAPFESAARLDWGKISIEELRQRIEKSYLIDQLQVKDSPQMTATEANIRYELMQRMLGPVGGRIQNNVLNRVVERTFMIQWREDRLPEMPDVVREAMGDQIMIDIEYTGPMSRAQKMDKIVAIERLAGLAANLAQLDPEVLDKVDFDEGLESAAEYLSTPAGMMRTEEETKRRRDARNQQANQAMQLENATQATKAAHTLVKTAGEMNNV